MMSIEGKPDTKIYRILSQEHFFQMFKEKKNVLVQPSQWRDKFENLVLQSPIKSFSSGGGDFSFRDDVYAQCWTLDKESDAMWQIYSNGVNTVKIRTTVGKLINGLRNTSPPGGYCYISEVDYISETQLREFVRNIFKCDMTIEDIARSLLVKRTPYEYEKEIRLIYIESENKKKHEDDIYKYSIDPDDMIEQVVLNPCMSDYEYACFKDCVIKNTSLTDKQVKHSSLYQKPKGFFSEIP